MARDLDLRFGSLGHRVPTARRGLTPTPGTRVKCTLRPHLGADGSSRAHSDPRDTCEVHALSLFMCKDPDTVLVQEDTP